MLNDILLALTGFIGDSIDIDPILFKYNSISLYSYRYNLRLKTKIEEYLSDTEKSLIKKILEIASDVYSINEFVKNVQGSIYTKYSNYNFNLNYDNDNNESIIKTDLKKRLLRINPVGFYIHAIVNCIQEYMIKYLKKINQLEKDIFENPSLPLTYILTCISKPGRVLKLMMNFIEEWYNLSLTTRIDSTSRFSFSNMFISMEKFDNIYEVYISVPCGYILDYFYTGINTGDILQEAVNKNFLLVCNRIFCYQIINWITLGKLVDPFEEFIVGRFCIDNISEIEKIKKDSMKYINLKSFISNDRCVKFI